MAKKTKTRTRRSGKGRTRKTVAGAIAVRRGRPTIYNKALLKEILGTIKATGRGLKDLLTVKKYYGNQGYDYVSVVNAMRREGLSVRKTLQALARK